MTADSNADATSPTPDPGQGYRLLSKIPSEPTIKGDQYLNGDGSWSESNNWRTGGKQGPIWYRRKIESAPQPSEPSANPGNSDQLQDTSKPDASNGSALSSQPSLSEQLSSPIEMTMQMEVTEILDTSGLPMLTIKPSALKPKVLYVAGPMRGIPWFNYPMFDRISKILRDQGHEVINPADEDRKQDGFDPFANPFYSSKELCEFPAELDFRKTVRRCLDAVLRCDEIVLLPGWERSSGALAELTLAMWLGKRIQEVSIDANDQVRFAGYWMPIRGLVHRLDEEHFPEHHNPPTIHSDDQDDDDPADILEEALDITRGSRNAQYGPPDQDFRRTAGMWSVLFAAKLKEGVSFEPRDVALAMILLKTSRETHQRKRDNWVDIAGYARCGSLCNDA